jgi:hypothetical protein
LNNLARSVVNDQQDMPATVGSTSFSMETKRLLLIAGFHKIEHILTNQSVRITFQFPGLQFDAEEAFYTSGAQHSCLLIYDI